MQQDSLKKWETANLSSNKQLEIFRELRRKAESPMGVALTHVLLSLNQKNTQLNLRDFPEMLPNLCLAGMNFHLSGVDEKARNWSGLNLSGVDFRVAYLEEVQFEKSQLGGTNLQNANLSRAKLQNADLWRANLQHTNLSGAELQNADLRICDLFGWEQLEQVKNGGLTGSKITEENFKDKIYPAWKAETDPEWEALTEGERMTAMQKFHGETGVCIYDKARNQIIP